MTNATFGLMKFWNDIKLHENNKLDFKMHPIIYDTSQLTLQIEFDSICYYIVKFEKQKPNQPPFSKKSRKTKKKTGKWVPFCCTLGGGVDLGLGITYEELCIQFSTLCNELQIYHAQLCNCVDADGYSCLSSLTPKYLLIASLKFQQSGSPTWLTLAARDLLQQNPPRCPPVPQVGPETAKNFSLLKVM
ncbi:hypothetical protein AGLY_003999 [Aphis glycines]|uniref:Uncharacterized protein n=1 Tax=Aphis glycines TaxID=307491 RepID=A0A6G0TXB4_APHGL|nr:hypothetical protein AGLY_003999 [Aphis glycines]